MGRPRGKGKKSAEAGSNDDDGSGSSEEVAPTNKRSVRPQKPLKDDDSVGMDDIAAKAGEDGDGVKPIVPSKDPKSSVESSGGKKRRRRRRRQVKGSSDSVKEDDKDGENVGSKPNGFRRHGSRRKNTPRRAAEAGVECT